MISYEQLNLNLYEENDFTVEFSSDGEVVCQSVNSASKGTFQRQFSICHAKTHIEGSSARDFFDKEWLLSKEVKACAFPHGELRIADLFSGCGGMSLGVTEACRAIGVKPIHSFAIEWDPVFAEVYRRNFKPKQQTVGDIVEVMPGRLGAPLTTEEHLLKTKVGSVDLLCGGPPCQGHSDLNNYTRRNDPRNALYNRMARAAEIFAPSTILIENVPGVRRDKTGVFSETISFLENAGYSIKILTLNAADFGVPQSRKRTFVIASKLPRTLESFEVTLGAIRLEKPRSVDWALTPVNAGNAEFYQPSKLSKESSERVRWLFENDQHELPDRLRPDCHKLKRHTYKSVYGRMFADKPAPTITTGCLVMGQGRFIHPHEPRTITPHEAARLQSFPDFFDFGVQKRTTYAKMIGNAVPPLLAYAVSLSILCQ